MKKLIALFFLLILSLQVLPLAQLAGAGDSSYSWVDEDKPEAGKKKLELKEFLAPDSPQWVATTDSITQYPLVGCALPSPARDTITPPPDGTC